jgi:hypothetical protein
MTVARAVKLQSQLGRALARFVNYERKVRYKLKHIYNCKLHSLKSNDLNNCKILKNLSNHQK